MTDLDVRIVRLEPMRVAWIRIVSETPEHDAWEKLRPWAEALGLLENPKEHPVFGFNNPNPSLERKEYGYEFWIRVDPGFESRSDIGVKDFDGGLYAVATCQLIGDPSGNVPEIWKKLWDWTQASEKYQWRRTHELEHPHDPQAAEQDFLLDLYLPIAER